MTVQSPARRKLVPSGALHPARDARALLVAGVRVPLVLADLAETGFVDSQQLHAQIAEHWQSRASK